MPKPRKPSYAELEARLELYISEYWEVRKLCDRATAAWAKSVVTENQALNELLELQEKIVFKESAAPN